MFRDIELKINYHKEQIVQSFIKKGIFPNNKLIEAELNSIETRLAIFKHTNIKEGSAFDTKAFNEAIAYIYNDLRILYQLLYEVTVEEFNKLDYYINSHLVELEESSEMYLKRAELESYTTSIGKSILFKYKGFDIDKTSTISTIDLGEVSISDASRIVCIANIDNVDHSDIIFKFNNDKDTIYCNSYSYNHDFVIFPGTQIRKEYLINTINEEQKINGKLELPVIIDNMENSTFITLAGRDKISCKKANKNGEIIEEKPVAINALNFTEHSYIDFYVVGGNSISFRFNKQPISTNFNTSSNIIENLDYIHHFFIECDKDFSFDFEIDKGKIYALKETTIVDQNKLYYSGNIEAKDLLLIHTTDGELKKYNASVNVYNTSLTEDDIKSIMIKKIN